MGDVDDKTSALIAKLLSEDNAYADYGEQEYALQESDDSDYGGSSRKKKAKKGTVMQACLLISNLGLHNLWSSRLRDSWLYQGRCHRV